MSEPRASQPVSASQHLPGVSPAERLTFATLPAAAPLGYTVGVRLAALLCLIGLLLPDFPCQSADGRAPGSDSSRTILFVDDHDVLYRPGTRRVLQPLKRHPANPVLPGRDKPWEAAIAWISVHRDPATGRYQLWYQAFAGDEAQEKTRRCVVCYAESADALRIQR